MRKIKLLFTLLICNFLLSQGTELPKVISSSPNVASLRKYGEIPVNNYTGVPSNKIPIYTIKSGDIEVPISISYHSSGIKVTDEASWVGLGWTLNAGGVITRQVRERDDFSPQGGYLMYRMYNFPIQSNTFTIMNNYQRIKYSLYPYDVNYPPSIHEVVTPEMKAYTGGYISSQAINSSGLDSYGYPLDLDPMVGPQDGEPDIYHFNFLGYSGKILIGKNGGILKFMSNMDDQLSFNYNIDTKKWTVKDIRGFEYEFGVTEYSRSIQTTCATSDDYISDVAITGWYISKIKSPEGNEINFEYLYNEPSTTSGASVISQNGVEEQGNIMWGKNSNPVDSKSYFTTSVAGYCIPMGINNTYNRTNKNYTTTNEKYLKKISFKEGYVNFNMSSIDRSDRKTNVLTNASSYISGALDNITVYDKNDKNLGQFIFKTSYFNPDKINLSNKQNYLRLKLDEFIAYSNSSNPQKYRFQYDSSPLPAKDSYSVDQWGYYNGASNNIIQRYKFRVLPTTAYSVEISENYTSSLSTLIPYYSYLDNDLIVRIDGADRNPNKDFIQAGILKTIFYPTGGKTKFTYEPNTYYKADGKNRSETSYIVNALGINENTFTVSEKSFVKLEYSFTNNASTYEYSNTQIYPKVLATDVSIEKQGGTTGKIRFLPEKVPASQNNLEYFLPQTKTSLVVLLEPGTYKLKANNGGFVYFDLGLKAIVENKSVSTNQIGAGLRIKSIQNIDGAGGVLEKQFSYTENDGKSTGVVMSPIFNFYNASTYMEGYMSNPPSVPYFADMESALISSLKNPIYKRGLPIVNFIEASGSSFLPLGNSAAGQSLGYSQVTVSNVNSFPFSVQKNIGKSVYKYNNFPDINYGATIPYVQKDKQHDENGQLINEYHYDSENRLLSEKEYKYNFGETFTVQGLRVMRSSSPYCFINPLGSYGNNMASPPCDELIRGVIFDRFYEEKINWWYPSKVIEKNYLSGGGTPIVTTQNFSYENLSHKQLTKEQTVFPDATLQKTYKYADEEGNQLMKSKNMIGIPLLSETQKTVSGATKTIQKLQTEYPKTNAETATTNGLILPLTTKTFGLDNLNTPNMFVSYDKYDSRGNLLQYSEQGIKPTTFIWGYSQTLPIAKIEGIGYDTITNIGGVVSDLSNVITKSDADIDQATENDLILALDNFRKNPNLIDYPISTYTYDPLVGLTSVTTPSGIREIYKYDDNHRLKQVIDGYGKILKENNYNYSNGMADDIGLPNILGPENILLYGGSPTTVQYSFSLQNIPSNASYYWSIVSDGNSNGATSPQPYNSSTVSTTFSGTGNYTLNAYVYVSSPVQESFSISKVINVSNLSFPPYGSNNFTALPQIEIYTSGIYLNANTVSGHFVFKPGNFTGSKDIAFVSVDKAPLSEKIVNYNEINTTQGINRQWVFTFKTNGVVNAAYSGTPLSNDSVITVNSFQYQK